MLLIIKTALDFASWMTMAGSQQVLCITFMNDQRLLNFDIIGLLKHTMNMERFAGLNIHGFSPMKFSWEYFCGTLASSVYYYLTITKYSQENFRGTAKLQKLNPANLSLSAVYDCTIRGVILLTTRISDCSIKAYQLQFKGMNYGYF